MMLCSAVPCCIYVFTIWSWIERQIFHLHKYDMSFCNEKCSKYISKKTITPYTNCCSKAFTDVVVISLDVKIHKITDQQKVQLFL